MTRRLALILTVAIASLTTYTYAADKHTDVPAGAPLANTAPFEMTGDLAEQMVDGIDRFLLREIEASVENRARHWQRDTSSAESYNASVAPNRARLAKILGVVDQREPITALQFVATTAQPALVARGERFEAFAVRWPTVRSVCGEGLLLVPTSGEPVADVIALPDAGWTPEQLAGLTAGVTAESQFARWLAESGCRVLVPALIGREQTLSETIYRKTNQPHREFLYRPAFELGRHIIGYEVQKVLAAVDWLTHEAGDGGPTIGLVGYGEGGLLALYAAALDPRIDAACVSGYFDSRQDIWREPIYRNVFGLLDQFGDAELASLVAPRALMVEACRAPRSDGPPPAAEGRSATAAPGRLAMPSLARVQAELTRAAELTGDSLARNFTLVGSDHGNGAPGNELALKKFLETLAGAEVKLQRNVHASPPRLLRELDDPAAREKRLFDQINADTQHVLAQSEKVRDAFWSKADRASRDPAKFVASTASYRQHFYDEVIGRFEQPLLPANPRSRQIYDEPLYTGYEVVLDVFPDVFAYGILLVPKNIPSEERRPVVVCQHGLEGRPTDVADPRKINPSYNQYACRLAERGFVVFAPQNPYIFGDKFRTLQRKANPLGKSLFSIIVPQHQQIVDWLATLGVVDPDRIAFYGLSYGGKTAMRVPALVPRYCLSICSADFSDWVWKNASTDSPYTYVTTGEYEIFEFDLGSTYNYAEMAALIAPRPFMVERGHRDGVGPDTRVAYEYAKIRQLYADLMIPERTEIEFFDGPHTIHGVGTFEFLHDQLRWPRQLNR